MTRRAAPILAFTGRYRFLSNFVPARVTYDGATYPSVEHAYQAAKTPDLTARARIATLSKAGEAKRAGRRITLRPDWDAVKVSIMEDLVHQKFRHPELADQLLATGDAELVEGNTWGDTFWGECNGRGLNHLGRILMRVRASLGGVA